jgi:hypothetical protein
MFELGKCSPTDFRRAPTWFTKLVDRLYSCLCRLILAGLSAAYAQPRPESDAASTPFSAKRVSLADRAVFVDARIAEHEEMFVGAAAPRIAGLCCSSAVTSICRREHHPALCSKKNCLTDRFA